ncbi:MAG: lipase class 2 [Thermoleophilia bacterium]|nr:lipase class 2 [Thermoleophilia bacterium]
MGGYERGIRTVWRGAMRAIESRIDRVGELGHALPGVGRDAAPVLLVHGYGNDASAMGAIERSLARDGFRVSSINLADHGFGDALDDAAAVRTMVDRIRAETGAAHVDLVGHSRGGLVARAAKQLDGGSDGIGRVVTLSSANQGLHLGPFDRLLAGTLPEGMQQIRRGSSLISDLHHTRGTHDLAAVGTEGVDGVLVPASATWIEGAPRTVVDEGRRLGPLSRVTHYGILHDDRAYEGIRGALLAQP